MIDIPAFVHTLISQARTFRASDIHMQPYPHHTRVRFRVDGVLYNHDTYASEIAAQVIARIKVLSKLDVAEKRRPQDGMFRFESCDIRVATFPAQHGEKVVLRVLDAEHTDLTLDQLGLSPLIYSQLTKIAGYESGFFLVTGPTGSGKTTTLHALISSCNTQEKNIVTLEDPIEYMLPGVTQSQVNPRLGLTFQAGLRALLRQDPDVIMVGEIRDSETAHVAVQAALTGHHVMSTLHTIDAPSALMRLMHMGCEPFLVVGAVQAIVAQRLVRRVCQFCKVYDELTDQERVVLGGTSLDRIVRARGCTQCRNGYAGRVGIFQLLIMNDAIRSAFIKGVSHNQLVSEAQAAGMGSLAEDAFSKLEQGIIDIREYTRVLLN